MEFLGLIILAVLIILYMMKNNGKNLNQISAQELKSILGDGDKQFIDVRTPGEYKRNHIRHFKNMPLQTLQQHADTLSTEREIIVICQSGMRSANACKLFKQKGFTNVTNVKGGMNSWLN
ncbi:rhodanese-like domain-containing protein [Bacillus sp. BHET2]|uniref:rhodanese-like domain-containing protein n=1 Tax=Bacillus sp. BHET2 TaxID=2583818 RepID=UPI00110D3561|nr:rhodanese-like domain-containing protein [Bacillus sp. BHET2]TMU87342.1 rhodanese-like domain-containing protein [Bacillus sp. BHET2]